jgi:hypothetical protein
MSNGKDISDPNSGFDPKNPYENRDPRLKYSIFVLGEKLPNGQVYDSRPGSGTGDAIGYAENSTATGFNVKKYLNNEDLAQPSNCGINIIFIRYAEVLLTYAEAMIESNQIDASVLAAINEVRSRSDVNMPPIDQVSSQDDLREIVRRERLVELAFEGLRYFDIRRWKIASVIDNRPIRGMEIIKNLATGATTYTPVELLVKVPYEEKMNLLPIETTEIRRNSELSQTPGW